MKINKTHFLSLIIVTLLVTSCSQPKNIIYFKDMKPGQETVITAPQSIKLVPNDKLSIIVSTQDPRLNSLFNQPITTNRLSGNTSSTEISSSSNGDVTPYTIDNKGDIMFPVLGKLHIAGMNREEVAEYIRRELISRDLAKNPIVTVDYLNLAVSVMGEVKSPGRYGISREDFTILDALSAAGDLTIYGKRDNIKVLRVENGVQKIYSVDINSGKDLIKSPVYYLQQNDVVYVEPNATQQRTSTPTGNTWNTPGIWISLLSVGITVATFIITLTRK